MKVWITKYALTRGIFEAEGEIKGDMFSTGSGFNGNYTPYYGNDWHMTIEDALVEASMAQRKRILELKSELAKLEALTFDV